MRTKLKVAAVLAAGLLLTACTPPSGGDGGTEELSGSPAEGSVMSEAFDISELCGDDEIQVALTYGAGGNTYRNIVQAEFESEAEKCDNITDVYVSDAGNDPQKASADVAGFVAQGVDIILPVADHGDAMIPTYRDAFDAGATVIPFFAPVGGSAGVDFSDAVVMDYYGAGVEMAEWMLKQIPSGNVAVLGGIASCTNCHEMYEGVRTTLDGTALTLLGDDFVATEYSPEPTERAVAGLLSRYGQIDGLISDYGVVAEAALAAITEAGAPAPALALANGQNSVYCGWAEAEEAGAGYAFAAWEGGTRSVRSALRWGLADYYGLEYDEPKSLGYEKVIDTSAGLDVPACEPDAPADKDMFSSLTEDEMAAALD
jgi:ribose transport system substrate-binding protein